MEMVKVPKRLIVDILSFLEANHDEENTFCLRCSEYFYALEMYIDEADEEK